MSQSNEIPRQLPVVSAHSAASAGPGRRAMLQTLFGSMAAGAALPALADAQTHPLHRHLAEGDTLERARQNATAQTYTPERLDAHALATLASLSEAIVPGSTDARVAPFLDQLLAVESTDVQRTFLGAIGAFDMAAIESHGSAWTRITDAQRDGLLRRASTSPPTAAMLGHFEHLKTWIAGAYYSSEPGMRELGWDSTVVHESLPGCTHGGGHGA